MVELIFNVITRNRLIIYGFFLFFITGFSACSSFPATPEPEAVTVQLSWVHQAEFAGLYAAEQQGYFAEEGIAVTFIEGGIDAYLPFQNDGKFKPEKEGSI